VDTEIFFPERNLPDKYEEPNPFNFGVVASQTWRKHLTDIIDAYSLALQLGMTNTNLYLCTTTYVKTTWMPNLQIYQKKMGVPVKFSRIALLNLPVTHRTIASFYNMLHCYLSPFSESFGLTTLESMACGTVPIIIGHGALPEIAGNSALYAQTQRFLATDMGRFALVDVQSLALTMKWARENPKNLLRLAEKGINRAKMFPWEKSASRLSELLNKLT